MMATQVPQQTQAPQQQYCRLLIETANGRISDVHLPIPQNQSPKAFAASLRAVYRKEVGLSERFERFSHRFREVVVSTVTLEQPANPQQQADLTTKDRLPISSSTKDDQLTGALQQPSVLKEVDAQEFFEQYSAVITTGTGKELPCTALMIHVVEHERTRGDIGNSVGFYSLNIINIVASLLEFL